MTPQPRFEGPRGTGLREILEQVATWDRELEDDERELGGPLERTASFWAWYVVLPVLGWTGACALAAYFVLCWLPRAGLKLARGRRPAPQPGAPQPQPGAPQPPPGGPAEADPAAASA